MGSSAKLIARSPNLIPRSPTGGFTLIETLVIVVILGILAAIAAPQWFAFVSNQRLNRANEQVQQAIRQGQAEAKRTGTYRQVRFDFAADPPQFAIVPVTTSFNPNLTIAPITQTQVRGWVTIGQGSIPPRTIQITDNNPNSDALIFSPQGAVVTTALAPANPSQLPYIVRVNLRDRPTLRRCIRVESLLGAISQGNNTTTCP